MTDNFVKCYALIKSQCVSGNILDEYLPFVATIIVDEGMDIIDENIICTKLKEKYNATFQPTFIRQVLSNAMDKRLINRVREAYVPNIPALRKYRIPEGDFVTNWNVLITDFSNYAKKHGYIAKEDDIAESIVSFIDEYDDHVIYNHIGDIAATDSSFLYQWCNYIPILREQNLSLYCFIEGLCMANIVKNTLFFTNHTRTEKTDLQVFLDTPMVFALLGMDTPERKEAYQYIIDKAKAAGMSLHVFDHNLDEVLGIIERAIAWSQRADYDPSKANKVAQYFHDSEMSHEDMVEYVGDVENMLNSIGITRLQTGYNTEENAFQADETKLSDAIKLEYGNRSTKYANESLYDNSVRTDVRSIVMTQRRRQGTLSTLVASAKAIFITTNSAIAKVSKDLMESDEASKNKIPTSITADIFGTLLWLEYGDENNDYKNYKLLADCKALLRPTPQMIAKFTLSLDKAYQQKVEGLTEEKFLFLRSHPIVQSRLLDVTSGDYNQFTDQTWRDVLSKIEAHAQVEGDRKYENEKEEHIKTKRELDKRTTERDEETKKNKELQNKVDKQQESYSTTIANIISAAIFAIPYLAISVLIVLVQNQYGTPTIKGIAWISVTVIVGLLLATLYKKLFAFVKKKVKDKL